MFTFKKQTQYQCIKIQNIRNVIHTISEEARRWRRETEFLRKKIILEYELNLLSIIY